MNARLATQHGKCFTVYSAISQEANLLNAYLIDTTPKIFGGRTRTQPLDPLIKSQQDIFADRSGMKFENVETENTAASGLQTTLRGLPVENLEGRALPPTS